MTFIKITACCLFCLFAQANAQDLLQENLNEAQKNQDIGNVSQQKVDSLYSEQREALQNYRLTEAEIEQLTVYNRQLKEIIGNQDEQVESLKNQIKQIEVTQRGIMPLMDRMLNGLQRFVKLDTPFLLKEREERIANLRALLLGADTTVSEKFRRVLEAYQIEVEYGRTIEAYRGENQNKQTVDFLRVGRVALYYLPLSGSGSQIWNKKTNSWTVLDAGFDRAILKGIRIARKQSAPSLLSLKLPGLGGNQ